MTESAVVVGQEIEVEVRAPAHGGAMLAGIPGQPTGPTVFVRHALPGERGTARVTAVRSGGRLLFADLLQVTEPAPDRVTPPCPVAGPGGCGGCDLQHVAPAAQRALKAEVVADCLRRLGRLDPADLPWDGTVHALPGRPDGLRWRTRSRFLAVPGGLAMQARASNEAVPIQDCPIAVESVVAAAREAARGPGRQREIAAVASSTGEVAAGTVRDLSGRVFHERVAGATMEVDATGFWQVHPAAPDVLVAAVREVLQPRLGESLLDLYSGVGLFGVALATDIAGGALDLVEADGAAAARARRNVAGLPDCRVHARPVLPWLRAARRSPDLVVLDPPRSGAGNPVLQELHRLRPRAVAYVACDPAALARDLRTLVGLGWRIEALQAFDLFPMTHHVECVVGVAAPGRDGAGDS